MEGPGMENNKYFKGHFLFYLRLKAPAFYSDCLHKRQVEGVGQVKSSSIEVSKIIEVVGFVNNDDVGGSISSVGRGGQTRHCVATGTAQGGRRHSQVASTYFNFFLLPVILFIIVFCIVNIVH